MALVPALASAPALDDALRRRLIGSLRFLCRHWLASFNTGVVLFAVLPIAAPILDALGATNTSLLIFRAYSITCHQMPTRSYFIFGHQMAYCERNTAIYGTIAFAGLAYIWLRKRALAPLGLLLYLLLILPMAADGFTQLFALRESTWYLRGLTGTLFGIATAWMALPRLDENIQAVDKELLDLSRRRDG
jgi:uncharacterized membrane protein